MLINNSLNFTGEKMTTVVAFGRDDSAYPGTRFIVIVIVITIHDS